MVVEALLDLLILLAIFAFGALIVHVILSPSDLLTYFSLSFPLGGGVLTWLIFILGWAELDIFPTSFLITYILGTIIFLFLGLKLGRFRKGNNTRWTSLRKNLSNRDVKSILTPVFFLGMLILTVFLSIGRSYSTWDAIAIWSMRGYGISIDNSIFAASEWGSQGLTYPLNLSLQIAHFHYLDGDVLPGSKMIFPLFLASVIIGSYRFWRLHGISIKAAGYYQAFFWTVPYIFTHATIGYSNLPTACYLVLGYIWGVDGVFKTDRKAQIISGIMFGLASWTRTEAVLYSVMAYIAILISWLMIKRGKPNLICWGVPFFLITISWLWFFSQYGFSIGPAQATLEHSSLGISSGWFNLHAIGVILKFFGGQIMEINKWGVVYPLFVLGILVGWRQFRPSNNAEIFACFLGFLAYAAATAMIFYVFSFNSYPDRPERFVSWLSRGFARQIMPVSILAIVTLPFLFRNSIKNHSKKLSLS